MIVIKVLVQGIIISEISVYVPWYALDDSQKDDFYDILINFVRKLGEKEVLVIGDFNGQIGSNPENFEEQHGGYGYGVRNKEGERILEFCAGILFLRRGSHLITFESGPSKTQVKCIVDMEKPKKVSER